MRGIRVEHATEALPAPAAARLAAPSVAAIDAANIGLMLSAAALACVVPFELFALSYIVIGPLHYLTQLAWLRDRRFFTPRRLDPLLLAVPAAALLFSRQVDGVVGGGWQAPMLLAVVLASVVLVATPKWIPRIALLGAVAVLAWAATHSPTAVVLALMLPGAIHIFVFTGGFLLNGALRHRGPLGLAAFGVFLAIPTVLLLAPFDAARAPSGWVTQALAPFAQARTDLAALLGIAPERLGAVDRFFGWAYSYHYLNWFSKTRLIGWHRGTRARLGIIAVLWVACVALYAIDYPTGFMLVGFVGMLHVVLELPLDARTFAGLGPALVRLVRRA